MHIRFCLRGTSPLLLPSFPQAALQITTIRRLPFRGECRAPRDADGNVTIAASEIIRTLRGGALSLAKDARAAIRTVFGVSAPNFFNEVRCVHATTDAPFANHGFEPIMVDGVRLLAIPRLDGWMVRGTVTIDDNTDEETLRNALELGSETTGLGFVTVRSHEARGKFDITEWQLLPSSRTVRPAAPRHQPEA